MIGLWKNKNGKGFMSHNKGLSKDQIAFLQSLREGDKLVVFLNDVREGEHGAAAVLKRSTLPLAAGGAE